MTSRPMVLVCCAFVVGCGAELGGGAGVEARSGNAVGFGRVAVSTKLGTPANDHGLLVGASLESRAQQNEGSRWDTGIMLGWGSGPAAIDGRLGFEAYAEFGTPLHESLFRRGDLYAGLALAMPIHFGSPRHVEDLNESTWILTRRFEFVPLVRTRLHLDHPDGTDAMVRLDVTGGVTLRLRLFSDLF